MGKLRYIYAGDKVAAQAYIGEANKQHLKLRNSMRFQDLKIGQRSLQFTDGTIITNTIVHGIETATIYVPEVGGGEEQELYTECYCDCNFTVGTVVAAEDYYGLWTLTVACCKESEKYMKYYWLRASDFTPWEVGMAALLLRFCGNSYNCSKEPDGDYGINTGCYPGDNYIESLMSEDSPPDTDNSHGQGFIILPVCMFGFPKWIKKRVV